MFYGSTQSNGHEGDMSCAVYCQIEGSRRVSVLICASTSRTMDPIPKRDSSVSDGHSEFLLS